MGGASDPQQRSSSPLKRRASDLEADGSSSQKDDVDMIAVSPSNPADVSEGPLESSRTREKPVDMLANGHAADVVTEVAEEPEQSSPRKSTEIPPIDTQITTITSFVTAAQEKQLEDGQTAYLVSNRWLKRVTDRGSEARKKRKDEPDGEIGPIDNSDIVQQVLKDSDGNTFVQLRPGMGFDNFTLFDDAAWELILAWYGIMPGSSPITRTAHNTSPKDAIPNIQYEFNPPVFIIHRLHGEGNGIKISQKLKAENPDAPVYVLSTSTSYRDFLVKIKRKVGIDVLRKVRVWRVPRLQPAANSVIEVSNTATPPTSRPGSPVDGVGANPVGSDLRAPQDNWCKLFLDVPAFVKLDRLRRDVVDVPDVSINVKYNGSMNLATAGLAADQTIVLDEHIYGDNFVSNYVTKSVKGNSGGLSRTGNSSYIGSNSQSNSGRNSPAPSGPMTRGRAHKSGKTAGTVGLTNLGNTCYMNSALQCVRSVEELTKYFLIGRATEELNYDNPLGNNGEVAIAYGRLLDEIYKEPVPSSVAPRNFKNTIGKFAPSFSGYGQQDSQEFLGFLLDGLQEDLSRVKKKPYIEKPDSTDEMVNDPQAIRELASKVWDITKQRDDSVIADLFTGMYKSTLVCPKCEKVSITFDPFNNLTLQLPIENAWGHQVYYFPLNDKPVMISVDIDKNASIGAMKEFISKRVGVPAERLFACEEFKCKFYKIFKDSQVASEEINQSDHIAVYELEAKPTNWPPPRKAKKQKTKSSYGSNDSGEDDVPGWDDPVAERMLVPVFHRRPANNQNSNRYNNKAWDLISAPHFIILNPNEARSEDMVKRKILEKVATFTTSSELLEDDEANTSVSDSADTDMVLTTGSDAESSGGSKVVANSIDGEDEIVDVTMKEPAEAAAPTGRFNSRRPKFIKPNSHLNPSLQNMFEIGYFGSSKEMISSGWETVDEQKSYPRISSRNPPQEDGASTNGYEAVGSRAGSDSAGENEVKGTPAGAIRINEESEDSEEDGPKRPKALPVRTAGLKSTVRVGQNKRRNRRLKSYSRKGKNQAQKFRQDSHSSDDEDAVDDGPLVRPGEGLVVDWYSNAWEAMFTGDGPEDQLRGMPTWLTVPTIHDPELEALKASRAQRKKNGISLDDCLNEFGKEEILSEADTWYCPRCKEHRRASKKFELWKTPDILIMHLKRFSSSQYRRDKLDVLVDFPIEKLDLSSRVIETEDGKQEIYDLFAVDDHWGGLGGGHYTAFAKNFFDQEWYEYNDQSVSKLKDLSRVVSSSAYLLFYRRRSDVPLGGPKFKQIMHEYENPSQGQASDDEMIESGEGKGLVGNSSPRGSSSALTGAGAARHQLNHGSRGEETTTTKPLDLDGPPDYSALNFGLRRSIEDDEGVELGYDAKEKWNFDNLPGDNEFDAASDIVENNSSASAGSIERRKADFADTPAEDSTGEEYVDASPVPDLDEIGQASHIALQQDLFETGYGPKLGYSASAEAERFDVEEPVTEIHISDNDEPKVDYK
ncbi:ubiquitin carboxyl-terminal hydrolase [Diplocarpon rosae]|nr:ubiquitin carboxyl-terminal hydrolase [Diplocarpon rosae]